MKAAISQSNYIPWKGYFDIIARSDIFVLYDEVQYTRRDWRNRNKIKTHTGAEWLTIPVEAKGKYDQKIIETHISSSDWAYTHIKSIQHNYAKAPYFKAYFEILKKSYEEVKSYTSLSQVNYFFLKSLCETIGINTPLVWSSDFPIQRSGKNERLLDILKAVGATEYISGPAAKSYMDEALFKQEGIAVSYMDYSKYPVYPQLHGNFTHEVSVIDVLFNTGPDARKYICTE